jgi:hypothetical protein
MGKQTVRQAARLAASEVWAKRRREPAERDRRLEKLAIEVFDCAWRTRCHHGRHGATRGRRVAGDDHR